MNVTITWDPPGPEDVLVETSGRPTVEELVDYVDEVFGSPRAHDGFRVLVDHTKLDLSAMTNADFRRRTDLIRRDRHRFPGAFWVAVVLGSEAAYGLVRMMQGAAQEDRIEACRSLEEARTWLSTR